MAEYIKREALAEFLKGEIQQCEAELVESNGEDDRYEQAVESRMIGLVDAWRKVTNTATADVVEVRWNPIAGYEGLYEVSTLGQVRNAKGCVMKQYLKRDKYTVYKKVALWKDGKYKQFYVHRLVAEAFIPNPNDLPIVNHKDEDGTNNLPNNLEWCDKSYNAKYGKSPERISKAFRNKTLTEDHKSKIAASMKAYRENERSEKGYCDNGRHKGAKMDGKGEG